MQWELDGLVEPGAGQARGFTALPWVREAFIVHAGIDPWPGTLNLRVAGDADAEAWQGIRSRGGAVVPAGDAASCDAETWPVTVTSGARSAPAAIALPRVPGYPPARLELVSPVGLRDLLELADGARVTVAAAVAPPGLAAVVFDVDGTLVDSIGAYHLVASRVAEPHGYVVEADMVRRALDADVPFWPQILGDRAGDDAFIATLRTATRAAWPDILRENVRCFDGARAALQVLRDAGLRLGICTASGGETFAALEAAGLFGFFDAVVTAADVTHRKPHPEGLVQCLARLGVEPSRAAYVGDTAVDVRASRAAGLWPVGVLTGAGDGASLAAVGVRRLVRDVASLPRVFGLGG
ncbi:MAG: HAD-IA family hydrolase [Chromatiales bacterium]|jgi:HAD superfamily hydrolase (TIGR01509 family)|nr:HAD-IA family hydrolase [Chromatiales bacterium]